MEERGRRKRKAGADLSTARIGKEVQNNAFKSVVQSEQSRQECRRTSCNNLDPQLVRRRESSHFCTNKHTRGVFTTLAGDYQLTNKAEYWRTQQAD